MAYLEAKARGNRTYYYLTRNRRTRTGWKKTRQYIGTSTPALPKQAVQSSPQASAYRSTLSKIRELEKCKPHLRKKFNIRSVGIFGSYARGEQRKNSDLDVLAEFDSTPSILTLIGAEQYLGKQLGMKVDLVNKQGLKPRFKKTIVSEAVMV
ncbi:MAG: nucleotidyltransferase family protein [Candidatus Micrarchaeota archaeon]|nr:nucleotidyltransferase family protein [Candidatus Micrarchaeota archaeon]